GSSQYPPGMCHLRKHRLCFKVEETPKKCKDIIKTARSLLNDIQFAQFGDDPKAEVMVLERILLQTIRFYHTSSYLNLCTMLSLQWEPEIIAVAVMYLAGRLSSRRCWEQFVQDVPVELLGTWDWLILDLYSKGKQQMPQTSSKKTPPPPPPPTPQQLQTLTQLPLPNPPILPPLSKKVSPQTSPPRSCEVGSRIPRLEPPMPPPPTTQPLSGEPTQRTTRLTNS
uniref:Cyclin C-terminal domain-containing protein n=1 Tax=Oncorhynchus mykiss TaxID=8022 RepID=A0A8K9UZC7_ONCMY